MELSKLLNGLKEQNYFDEFGNSLGKDPYFAQLEGNVSLLEAPRKVETFITAKHFTQLGEKTTVCTLETVFGYEVTGVSAPIRSEAFDADLGERFAYQHAVTELERMHAYLACYLAHTGTKD